MRTVFLSLGATLGLTALAAHAVAAGTSASGLPALDDALKSFDIAAIRSDVEWIAADARAGRDTPSAGLEETARYIADRLDRIGFTHGARDGFLYRYPLGWRQLDVEASHVTVVGPASRELEFGEDYFLGRLGDLSDADATATCVSVGDGGRREFGKADLKGQWAWCWDDGGSTRRTISRAQEAGAIGVVFTPGDDYDREPYAERFGGVMRYVLRGSLGRKPSRDDEAEDIPSLFLSREAARGILGDRGPKDLPAGSAVGVTLADRMRLTHPGGFRLFENVCGLWPGSDPNLRNEVLIVSAHYDHIGQRGDEIYNGADDNGSGTAALLALARALHTYGPMRRSVLLMWVSGEEKGLLGSAAWTKRPWLPEGMYPVANINVDMIGRNDPKELLITPSRRLRAEYNGIVKLAEKLAPKEGFGSLGSADEYWRRSDHMNFAENLDLPVAFLFADVHEDYHKPTDTADKIDYGKILRGTRLLLRMLDGMQDDDLRLRKGDVPDATEFGALVRAGSALADLDVLAAAVEAFRLDEGSSPDSLDDVLGDAAPPGFPEEAPVDPWGRDYVFEPGQEVRILSYGSDGKPGGDGEAADLVVFP